MRWVLIGVGPSRQKLAVGNMKAKRMKFLFEVYYEKSKPVFALGHRLDYHPIVRINSCDKILCDLRKIVKKHDPSSKKLEYLITYAGGALDGEFAL
jgi:hypothetical protein